ncbi:MAG: hypothetical protein R3B13_38655 [Polyangiaceae bacterium]
MRGWFGLLLLLPLWLAPLRRGGAAGPTWPELSTTKHQTGLSVALLPRRATPTLSLCARYATPRAPSKAHANLLRARGGELWSLDGDRGIDVCLRLPASELALAVWLLPRLEPADLPRSPMAQLSSAVTAPQSGAPNAVALVGDLDTDRAATLLEASALAVRGAAETGPPRRPLAVDPHTWVAWDAPARGVAERAAIEVALTGLARRLSKDGDLDVEIHAGSRLVALALRGRPRKELESRLALGLQEGAATKDASPLTRDTSRQVRTSLDDGAGAAHWLLDGMVERAEPRASLRHLQWIESVTTKDVRAALQRVLALDRARWLAATQPQATR